MRDGRGEREVRRCQDIVMQEVRGGRGEREVRWLTGADRLTYWGWMRGGRQW